MSQSPVQRVVLRLAPERARPHSGTPEDGVPLSTWLRHGEDPVDALARLRRGQVVDPPVLHEVTSDLVDLPGDGPRMHAIGLTYGGATGGVGTGGAVALPDEPVPDGMIDHLAPSGIRAVDVQTGSGGDAVETPVRVQRAGAYAVVIDGDRVLLTRLRDTDLWTLPGGGIDFGEHPDDAVLREVHEETGLRLSDVQLLGVSTRRWTGRAPYGRLEDFHAVRILYSGVVPARSEPFVLEVDGSTVEAAWIPRDRFDELEVSRVTAEALRQTR